MQSVGIFAAFLVLGIGTIAPWGAFVSAVDYLADVYSDYDVIRWLTVVYYVPMLIVLVGNISARSSGLSAQIRVVWGFLIYVFGAVSVPIIDLLLISINRNTSLAFALLLVFALFVGFASGIVEGSLYGIALSLPQSYYQALCAGTAGAALTMLVARLFTKAAFSGLSDALRISAYVFFGIAAMLCLICLLLQKFVVIPYMHCYQTLPDSTSFHAPLIPPSGRQLSVKPESMPVENATLFKVFKQLRVAITCMMLTYAISTTLIPGIPSDVEDSRIGEWYKTLMMLMFSLGDFVSRWAPRRWILTTSRSVIIWSTTRFIFLAACYLAVRFDASPIVFFPLIFLVGFTNGYVALCCYTLGQASVEGEKDSAIAGNLLVLAFVAGVCLGSFAALCWSAVVS